MKSTRRWRSWLASAAFLLFALSGHVLAATSDNVDIHVSIAGSKEIVIEGTTFYDFGALDVAVSSVSASSITVKNNSTVFVETFTITGADAISTTGGTDWQLASSTGTDQYALGAQFSNSRPSDTNSAWDQDALQDGIASTCNQQVHGNGVEAEGGSNINPNETRGLWFRLKTPSAVSDGSQHDITITVSVL